MSGIKASRAGDPRRGLALVTEAVERAPENAALKLARAEVLMANGEHERALADLDAVFRGGQSAASDMARRLRAQALFNLARWREALAAYDLIVASGGSDAGYSPGQRLLYAGCWRFLVQGKLGADGRADLRSVSQRAAVQGWPLPLARFLLREITAEELQRTARSDGGAREGAECEASFIEGAVAERDGRRAAAEQHFRAAQQRCHYGMYERWAAEAELARLRR